MQKLFCLLMLLTSAAMAASAPAPTGSLGKVVVTVDGTIPVRVSANTPELNDLARRAFGAHGRYRVVGSGFTFDIQFTALSATQVRVDITKGLGVAKLSSDVVTGTNPHNALLRAADLAVEKTNGVGLKGFFTARLTFLRDLGRAKEVCNSDLFFSPGEVRQNTDFGVQALSPKWSPDGRKIIFTSFVKQFPDIYLVDAATKSPVVFEQLRGTNTGARFSPNGQQVAMVLSAEGQQEIYVSDAQGRHPSRRTYSDVAKASPCWSPDGARIVFTMQPGPQLYVMAAGGGAPQKISMGYRYVAEPDWCRTNPNKIACTVSTGAGYQIAVYDFSKGKAEVVSKAPFDGQEPSWLADGRHLVYSARTTRESVLCILDTETGKSTPISPTSFGSALQANVWTP